MSSGPGGGCGRGRSSAAAAASGRGQPRRLGTVHVLVSTCRSCKRMYSGGSNLTASRTGRQTRGGGHTAAFGGCSCAVTATREGRQDTDTARGDEGFFHFSPSDFARQAGWHSAVCLLLVKAIPRYRRAPLTQGREGPSFRAERAAKAGEAPGASSRVGATTTRYISEVHMSKSITLSSLNPSKEAHTRAPA